MEQNRRSIVTPDGAVLSVHVHARRDLAPNAPTLVLAHDWTLTPKRSQANFAYYARRALAAHPDTLTA